jgi:transketolase
MRDAFFGELAACAAEDETIWALTGDLGIGLFDEFERVAPGRYLNVGIAEQNLVGIAAGLAYAGKTPIAYSIAPFLTSRPHDQVRVDVALARADVKLVGVGGGVAYGTLGPTHHAIEDIALMRALPNMTVLTPADPAETAAATRAMLAHDGPVYLRLGKNGEPAALPEGSEFRIGHALTVRHGGDIAILSCGPMLTEALAAAELLEADGISARVVHIGTIKPFDAAGVAAACAGVGTVVTVEEHTVLGGLGSAVAETLAEAGCGVPLRRIGMPDCFAHAVGSRDHLIRHYGLNAPAIAAAAKRAPGSTTERAAA